MCLQGSSQEKSLTDAGSRGGGGGGLAGQHPMWLRMGQPMAVHPNQQLIGWAGTGYFPGLHMNVCACWFFSLYYSA